MNNKDKELLSNALLELKIILELKNKQEYHKKNENLPFNVPYEQRT